VGGEEAARFVAASEAIDDLRRPHLNAEQVFGGNAEPLLVVSKISAAGTRVPRCSSARSCPTVSRRQIFGKKTCRPLR